MTAERVDDHRVVGALDAEPDELEEGGVDDLALVDAGRAGVADVVLGALVGLAVLGQPQVVRRSEYGPLRVAVQRSTLRCHSSALAS